jgi:hypothetical protein
MTRVLHRRWWPLYNRIVKRFPPRVVRILDEQFFPPVYSVWMEPT